MRRIVACVETKMLKFGGAESLERDILYINKKSLSDLLA